MTARMKRYRAFYYTARNIPEFSAINLPNTQPAVPINPSVRKGHKSPVRTHLQAAKRCLANRWQVGSDFVAPACLSTDRQLTVVVQTDETLVSAIKHHL